MKKIFSILTITAVAAVVITACNRTPATPKAVLYEDTAGLAEFQNWKAMNERVDANEAYMNTTKKSTARNYSSSNKSGTMTSSSSHTALPAKKKGWSKAAKYSAIGGGAGIVLGAVINKRNRVAGGVIGGVLGAGAGYGIGRSQDKKDGRY